MVFLIKVFAKAPLLAIFAPPAASCIRYFLIAFFAAGIWPMCFPYLEKIGRKN